MTQAEKLIWAAAFALHNDPLVAYGAVGAYRSYLHTAQSKPKTQTWSGLAQAMLLEFAEEPTGPGACQKCGSLMVRLEDGSCRNCGHKEP